MTGASAPTSSSSRVPPIENPNVCGSESISAWICSWVQSKQVKGFAALGLAAWMARATSLLPVPGSPVTSTAPELPERRRTSSEHQAVCGTRSDHVLHVMGEGDFVRATGRVEHAAGRARA